MTLCLSTTIIKPEKNIPIECVVILLHGYGGDGKDISMLTLNWKRFLPNAIFLCFFILKNTLQYNYDFWNISKNFEYSTFDNCCRCIDFRNWNPI